MQKNTQERTCASGQRSIRRTRSGIERGDEHHCRFWVVGQRSAIAVSIAALLAVFPATTASAQTVHHGTKCGPTSGSSYGESEAIPNDPDNRQGWLLETQTDDAGNKIEIWCIEIDGGVGNSFGFRYIPAGGGTPRWIGRCAFERGKNTFSKEPTGDANHNGRPDSWSKAKWTSEDDSGGGAGDPHDDDQTPGKKDFDWEFVPSTNNLTCWETLNGNRIDPDNPDYNGPAPDHFVDVCGPAHPQPEGDGKAGVKVAFKSHIATEWEYELSGNDLTQFSHTMVYVGDKWSIAVDGVFNASGPPYWTTDYTSDYVTWTYYGGAPLDLSADGPVSGFVLSSEYPMCDVYWISDSQDDDLANFGFAGVTKGPMICPPDTTASRMPGVTGYGMLVLVCLLLLTGVVFVFGNRRLSREHT